MANLFQWIASAYCRTPYSSSRALLSLINVFFFSYYFFFFAAHYHQFSLFHASYADDAVQMKRECQFPLPPNIFWLSHMYTINQHELGLIICNKIRIITLLIEFVVDQNAVPVAANDVWYAPKWKYYVNSFVFVTDFLRIDDSHVQNKYKISQYICNMFVYANRNGINHRDCRLVAWII